MTVVDALQVALAAEHAAVHVYAALGARTPRDTDAALRAALDEAYAVHRGRRDALARLVRDEGGEPAAAEPSYELPVGDVAAAARELERAGAATYAWLVANTAGAERRWAIEALTDAAVRVLAFRGSPEIFPGVGEHADR